jgi:hypothetical protein
LLLMPRSGIELSMTILPITWRTGREVFSVSSIFLVVLSMPMRPSENEGVLAWQRVSGYMVARMPLSVVLLCDSMLQELVRWTRRILSVNLYGWL